MSDFDPFDPVNMAMRSLHSHNLLSAKDAEIAKLKAEVERLKEGNECLGQMHDKEMERSSYLLEEFNRTTAWGRGLESDLSHARVEISFLKAEVKRLSAADSYLQDANEHAFEKRCDELEAEVERLRASSFVTAVPVEQYVRVIKAGDELLDGWIGMYGDHKGSMAEDYIKLWNAAKDGKPSV